jgi:hypothetical protein
MSYGKVDDVKLPGGDGTNNTDVAKFTLTAASLVGALPVAWNGHFVRIRPVGGNMWFYITNNASAAVANPASDASGALGPTRGEYVADGELFHGRIPDSPDGTPMFIARIGSAVGDVYVTKASGKPGNNTDPIQN